MKKGKIVLVVLVFLTLAMLGIVSVVQAEVPHRGSVAIGGNLSLPAIGQSIKYWFTNKWCGQLTFVPSIENTVGETQSTVDAFSWKISYKLKEGRNHYFYGAFSTGNFSLHNTAGYQDEYEMHLSGNSLSIGFEWLPRKWCALSFEIGYGQFNVSTYRNEYSIDLGEEYETINSPIIGIGFHSYFF